MDDTPTRLDVEALHVRLCERLAELHPPVVAEVMRVFLEVSTLPCEDRLWSLEFAFDEDDGRIARLEARFVDREARDPSFAPSRGYEVHVLLPKVIPARAPVDEEDTEQGVAVAAADGSLVARFVRALTDLGAYRTIEPLEAVSADVLLL